MTKSWLKYELQNIDRYNWWIKLQIRVLKTSLNTVPIIFLAHILVIDLQHSRQCFFYMMRPWCDFYLEFSCVNLHKFTIRDITSGKSYDGILSAPLNTLQNTPKIDSFFFYIFCFSWHKVWHLRMFTKCPKFLKITFLLFYYINNWIIMENYWLYNYRIKTWMVRHYDIISGHGSQYIFQTMCGD